MPQDEQGVPDCVIVAVILHVFFFRQEKNNDKVDMTTTKINLFMVVDLKNDNQKMKNVALLVICDLKNFSSFFYSRPSTSEFFS